MVALTQSAVAGSSCMTPMAPALDTTRSCQPDSCQPTARAKCGRDVLAPGLLHDQLAASPLAARTMAAIEGGMPGAGAWWPGCAGRDRCAPGMRSCCPVLMNDGLASPFAAAMAVDRHP